MEQASPQPPGYENRRRSRWKRLVASGLMIVEAVAIVLIAGRFLQQPEEEQPQPPLPSDERPTVVPLGIESVQYPTPFPTDPPFVPPTEAPTFTVDPGSLSGGGEVLPPGT